MKLLITIGADVNYSKEDDTTDSPIYCAVQTRSKEMVKCLLEVGVEKTKQLHEALKLARKHDLDHIIGLLLQVMALGKDRRLNLSGLNLVEIKPSWILPSLGVSVDEELGKDRKKWRRSHKRNNSIDAILARYNLVPDQQCSSPADAGDGGQHKRTGAKHSLPVLSAEQHSMIAERKHSIPNVLDHHSMVALRRHSTESHKTRPKSIATPIATPKATYYPITTPSSSEHSENEHKPFPDKAPPHLSSSSSSSSVAKRLYPYSSELTPILSPVAGQKLDSSDPPERSVSVCSDDPDGQYWMQGSMKKDSDSLKEQEIVPDSVETNNNAETQSHSPDRRHQSVSMTATGVQSAHFSALDQLMRKKEGVVSGVQSLVEMISPRIPSKLYHAISPRILHRAAQKTREGNWRGPRRKIDFSSSQSSDEYNSTERTMLLSPPPSASRVVVDGEDEPDSAPAPPTHKPVRPLIQRETSLPTITEPKSILALDISSNDLINLDSLASDDRILKKLSCIKQLDAKQNKLRRLPIELFSVSALYCCHSH